MPVAEKDLPKIKVANATNIAAVTDTTITGSSLWARRYIEKGADITIRSWPSKKKPVGIGGSSREAKCIAVG